ncbi:MAG: Holliday junction resolvase RuvX [Gammaproteobacteria bacterium]
MTAPGTRSFLGFDFGTKRIGISLGQELTESARPLHTLSSRDGKPDWAAIEALIAEWKPDALVVGLPYNLDGSDSEQTERARRFSRQLNGRMRLPVALMDERLSSEAARREIATRRADGRRRTSRKGDLDAVAAALILENWLQAGQPGLCPPTGPA